MRFIFIIFLLMPQWVLAAGPEQPLLYHHGSIEGVIFPASKKVFSYNATSIWTPSVADIDKVESQIPEALKKYSEKLKPNEALNYEARSASEILPKLTSYKRQYGGIVRHAQKLIVIHFMCQPLDHWQEDEVVVDDGGSCFFEMEYDVNKNEFISFRVNGVG